MKKLLYFFCLSLPLIFSACGSDDDEPGFDVPELTDNNTIRFTVDLDKILNLNIEAILGEKIAVDWGDGAFNRYYANDPTQRIGHRYKSTGKYQVKIWSDKVTLFNISSLFYNTTDFQLGNCPELESLFVNSIRGMEHLKIGENCPKLVTLNVGSCPVLESLDVSKCKNIEFIQCYNNQALKTLDVSKNDKLRRLDCGGNQLEDLIGNKNLYQLNCSGNKLANFEVGEMKELTELTISENGISSIDLSELSNLSTFICDKNNLSTLDISNNSRLTHLLCNENQLTELVMDTEKGKYLRSVQIAYNELSKDKLYQVFDALPQTTSPKTSPVDHGNRRGISFNGNPGVDEAGFSSSVIENKGWTVQVKEKFK